MGLLDYVLPFLLALGILIVVHEFGHYSVARLCGVKVLRFSLGFGTPLLVRRIGPDQTEWVLTVFPLGGYVKMLDEREAPVAIHERHRAFNQKSVWQRIAIVAAGPLANFVLAIALYWGLYASGVEELRPRLGAPAEASLAAQAGFYRRGSGRGRETQRRQVRRLARRTWAFFERFAGPDDHWLPPDHFQESPRGSVAHYTTPTNIGLFLVSTLSAYDFSYMGLAELSLRLRSTFENMDKLEHYRGHLLNWYDSQTMTPLPPRYISTVDSGNLAACLITLKQGCLALGNAPLLGQNRWQGLLVILDILAETLRALEKNNPHASLESFEVELTSIYERVSAIQKKSSSSDA